MLSEMRAFATFADAGSVQDAAARLNLTQSAVTRQIQRLEDELGTALLDRRIKPPQITPTGRNVLERCLSILRDVAELKTACSPSRAPSGRFRIGIGYVLADDQIADCIESVARRFRDVLIGMRTDWHPALIEMVTWNQLDVAVIPVRPRMPLPAEVEGKIVGAEPLVFATDGDRPMGPRPTLAQFAQLPWIVKPKGTGTREILDAALAREGLQPGLVSEVRDENLQLSLVARGLGIALVTRRSVERHPRAKRLRSSTVRGLDLHLDVVMIRAPHIGHLAPVADAFAVALTELFRSRR
jgi:DNA-binding transcriptional LysR family regulator